MYRGHSVGVVVTAYNEAGFVGDVVDGMPDYVDRVYVVDDGSTDDTWTEIRRRGTTVGEVMRPDGGVVRRADDPDGHTTETAGGPEVVPIRHESNAGAGGATKTGYRRALSDGVDVVVVVNGDGQMDCTIMDRFLDPIVEGRADFAKGTRLSTPAHREPMSRWRLFGNGLLTGMTRLATGYWGLSDPQNGYTAISRTTLAKLDLDALYDRHGFLNDLIGHLSAADARIADVPHPAVYGDEESSIRYGQFVPGLSALLARHFLGRIGRRLGTPSFLPATVGYAGSTLSFVLAVVQMAQLAVGVEGPSPSTLVLSVLFGCLALAFAVAWDAVSGRYRDGGGHVRVERGDPA